ncbi:asparaginase [Thalassospira sp. MCCC 1A01428]|uniref:asparaginase n=1 Tax=Thalassospira sp. MCCC 1A01428 TaxID=1470575 RepID=UPI000A1E043A|nr:asparaginase [Thalassospira sp. MCCC 1A01428]OSQ37279.1 asparaginase [Thalassospira sp. MCCC 1A01428]
MSDHSRRIVVLGTGGTIAGSSSEAGANVGYTAGTVPVTALLDGFSAPAGFELHVEQVAQIDSKDMDFATWHSLLLRCQYWLRQDDVAGLIVTHGTDTIEETSFFLHSVLQSSKPVVMTCAMRPASSNNPDGPQNLRDAISVATTQGATGVIIVCAGEVHGSKDVSKVHPYRLNAFSSGDAGPIGYVEEGKVRLVRNWSCYDAPFVGNTAFPLPAANEWPRIEIILSHAGARGEIIDTLIREKQENHPDAVAGIVLGATGNGSLHQALEKGGIAAQDAGIHVLVATRCIAGHIIPSLTEKLPLSTDLSPTKARIALLLQLLKDRKELAVS